MTDPTSGLIERIRDLNTRSSASLAEIQTVTRGAQLGLTNDNTSRIWVVIPLLVEQVGLVRVALTAQSQAAELLLDLVETRLHPGDDVRQ